METCDALVVGGGPAGSTCAWRLRKAGLDVMVVDAAVFPRDKVCTGWITPQVVAELDFDTEEYRHGRTFQPITGFRVGLIDGREEVETRYGRPVSFGIRRREFDHYLLQRSGARLKLGMPATSIRKDGEGWIINDAIRTPMLIGAGGQRCPVARWINGPTNTAPLIVAQEAEFPVDSLESGSFAIEPGVPELYFCGDLKGYGWCVRKQQYLNVGLGRLDRRSLPAATAQFARFLQARGKVPPRASWPWHGHAYAVYGSAGRRVVDAGVMLVGDAAGLAYAESGEGIRPAVESGLLAAATIIEADGQYAANRLEVYQERLRARFAAGRVRRTLSQLLSAGLGTAFAVQLLKRPAFVRHVVLDRWFLHAQEPELARTA